MFTTQLNTSNSQFDYLKISFELSAHYFNRTLATYFPNR